MVGRRVKIIMALILRKKYFAMNENNYNAYVKYGKIKICDKVDENTLL